MPDPATPKPIWIVSDGKPGHLAQSRGLAQALHRLSPGVSIHELPLSPTIPAVDQGGDLPGPPRILLAAGRRTHQPALALRRRFGGIAIALMNPGLLTRKRFDLCVIPRHDGIKDNVNLITTEGALNTIQPAAHLEPGQGLILVGGPSHNHKWDHEAFYRQLVDLLARRVSMQWTATTSRRTPGQTTSALFQLVGRDGADMTFVPAEHTPPGWVAEQLARCDEVWVSEDSVSMIYEALSSGARVGLLPVPTAGRPGRVARGVESLVQRGRVVRLAGWLAGTPLPEDQPPLQEADRVAAWIMQERSWLND
ncbi:MAG: mitochondrial fission ELM1 family protein [Planctomycetota bacterium]